MKWFGASWGVIAVVRIPDASKPNDAYVRIPTGDFERVGTAVWAPEEVLAEDVSRETSEGGDG